MPFGNWAKILPWQAYEPCLSIDIFFFYISNVRVTAVFTLIPVITYVGPMTASILTGSLVVEKIFTIGGLGAKFVEAITNRDYPLIMGTTIFLAVLMVTMNLITDIVYKMIDPRIKLD